MKVLSLFSGIGAFEKALDNIKEQYELVGYCEIDKYASKSYSAIHNVPESMNLGDITKIDEKALPKDIDLVTYGFTCQDISLAGKQKGLFNEDGTQTRSGLFFEALRIIEEAQPKVAIAENVKNLVGKKFEKQFQIVLDSLEQAGYNNYWKVLNSKDFGIPQNRERVFIVSIRKDIDTGMFQFPEGFPLKLRLKDVLEDVVDEKFYISNKGTSGLIKALNDGRKHKPNILPISTEYAPTIDTKVGEQTHRSPYIEEQPILIGGMQKNQAVKTDGICTTLTSSMGTGGGYVPMITEPIRLGNIYGEHCGTGYAGNVWDKEAISPTLMTMQGGNRQPMVVVNEPKIEVVGNYSPSGHDASRIVDENGIAPTVKENHGTVTAVAITEPFIVASRGRNPENPSDRTVGSPTVQRLEPNSQGICNTLTTVQKDNYVVEPTQLRIRKLTPKECFRLQGFDDESFHRAEAVNSNTQLYKQAGNSITVDVLEYLLQAIIDSGVYKTKSTPQERFFRQAVETFNENVCEHGDTIDAFNKRVNKSGICPTLTTRPEGFKTAILPVVAETTRKEQKEMELKVNEYQLPSPITFNYEEIKQGLIEKVSVYETLVYTDEQIKDAKNDRANLNKLKKALNDERIRLEKEYMQPFNDTKAKFNEIISLIDKPVSVIDSQVKAFEEKQKEEKLQKIQEYIEEVEKNLPDDVRIRIDCKWLNASVSMKSVQGEIDAKAEQIKIDLATLQNLTEFGFEAAEVYKSTLDINRALNEGKRLSEIAKAKATYEAEMKARLAEATEVKKAEQIEGQVEFTDTKSFDENVIKPTQEAPTKMWLSFSALLSVEDAQALAEFMKNRNIQFKKI